MPIPKGMKINEDDFMPHIRKPDTDNLLKAVMDSITQAGVWKDDALVYFTEASKGYAQGQTGARIKILTEK
jgi:Holliday junction resolvase RusA-like endonuclease